MQFLPFLLIFVLWSLFVLLRTSVRKRWGWNLCPICAAVSTTWIILAFLWVFGRYTGTIEIGILMGMTVSGLISLLEKASTRAPLRYLGLAKLVLAVGGFAAVWSFLTKTWGSVFAASAVTILALAVIIFLLPSAAQKRTAGGLKDCC